MRKQRRALTSPPDRARGRRAVFSRVRGERGGERTLGVPLHAVRRRKLCLRACLSARVRVRARADRRQSRSVICDPAQPTLYGKNSRVVNQGGSRRNVRRSKTARFAALAFGSILTETHTRFRFFFPSSTPRRNKAAGAAGVRRARASLVVPTAGERTRVRSDLASRATVVRAHGGLSGVRLSRPPRCAGAGAPRERVSRSRSRRASRASSRAASRGRRAVPRMSREHRRDGARRPRGGRVPRPRGTPRPRPLPSRATRARATRDAR